MFNFESITASPEALAEFLFKVDNCNIFCEEICELYCDDVTGCQCDDSDFKERWLTWLKQPHREE